MIKLFHYDEREDDIVFDSDIIRDIKEFKELWRRKVGVVGDHRGDSKQRNRQEFLYVYYMAEWSSKNPFYALPNDRRHEKAKASANLPEEWKPDSIVRTAISRYIEMQMELTPTLRFLVQVEKVIGQSSSLIDIMQAQNTVMMEVLTRALEGQQLSDLPVNEITKEIVSLNEASTILSANVLRTFDALTQVKKAQSQLADLSKLVRQEEIEALPVTGGRKLGNRENPTGK